MSDLPNPINRYEKYLNAIATGNSDDLPTPTTREEVFLDYIARNGGGGGGGDVTGVKGNAESTYRKGNVNLTPANLGLGNVNNTSDAQKPVSTATQAALDGKVDKVIGKGLSENDYTNADKAIVDGVTSALAGKVSTSSVGSANGVAELDANGKVPSSQLPSYVDDVLEYADLAHFPATGETGKIYIAEDTNKTYRWSGSNYAEISESLALGETSSTAYAGNKGKANADAIAAIKDGANIDSFGDVETALAGKADVSALANYASLDNSGGFPDANNVTKELVYINGFQSDLINYPSEVSNTVGILLTRWFYYSGDLTVARMQLVFTLGGKSFCRFFDGTTWTSWISTSVGILSNLTTTDKSSCVGAINELVSGASLHHIDNDYNFADLTAETNITWFTNWNDSANFPVLYGSGVLIPSEDPSQKTIIYVAIGAAGSGEVYTNVYKNGAWGRWASASKTFTYTISSPINIKDFFKKLITQVDADLSGKPAYTIFNIFSLYPDYATFYGIVERQDAHAYAFSLSKSNGDYIYQGYYNLTTDNMSLYEFTGTLVS